MRNIKLVTEYDGTNYHGWQVQPNAVSIQETIEDGLRTILQENIRITASGRTDAGVHALGQVAHFYTESHLDVKNIQRGLNSLLPPDISIKEICDVDHDFHARYSAKSKIYRYIILNQPFPSPLYRNFSWLIHFHLDSELMNKAIQTLKGRHDFSSFQASGCNSHHPVREVYNVSIKESPNRLICLDIEANAFLKQMVRNIVGTIVDVGQGKLSLKEFLEILHAKDRKRAGITAPARGLFLLKVRY
ncbi:MAG: tRNA pseudouridine(38-40) synthase TruA [Thermodesulfobacteriota bacterium]|nr:tRNA pseudouridine(38-40) synthase TruA [Thermodesulfobacteriota bacterium]